MRNALRRCAALAAAGSLLWLGGCAAFRPVPPPPTAPVPLEADDPALAALLERLQATGQEREAVRAGAVLKLEGPGGNRRMSQNVVLARPARLRMEIQAFLVTAAVLVSNGRTYDYFQSTDRYRENGPVHPRLLWNIAGVPLTLEQAVHFLMGLPPPMRGLAITAGERLPDGSHRIELGDAGGRLLRRLEFDADGVLRRVEDWSAGGVLRWEVGYDRLREVGGEPFAHTVDFHFPRMQTRAKVAFKSVELNPATPDGTFVLEIPSEAESAP